MNRKNFDIAIIGGGFAGLSTALSLSDISPDLSIALIEKTDFLAKKRASDGKNFAISNNSIKLFQKINIWDNLKDKAGKIKDITISDKDSPFYLHFDSNIFEGSKQMGVMLKSHDIYNQLCDRIAIQKNIQIFAPNSYQDINFDDHKSEIIFDDSSKISAKLIIIADGRKSYFREKFQIETNYKHYDQTALVFDIKHSNDHKNIAYEKFFPEGAFAILPLKEQNKSSIVWMVKTDLKDIYLNFDQENLTNQLRKKTGDDLGDVKITSKVFSYDLELIYPKEYFYKKALLIADAAHAIHPIAGQGFNLGIKDIMILTDLVANNFKIGEEINSDELIAKYNKFAKFEAKKMILATDNLDKLFSNNILPVKIARDLGLAITQKIPKLKKLFIKIAGG
ncbi:FAD-dependent oxidoreductase [Rickettsiales bacterium]|nr:FAD-dependent oxidoreductase [Rickettsiales bacterium]